MLMHSRQHATSHSPKKVSTVEYLNKFTFDKTTIQYDTATNSFLHSAGLAYLLLDVRLSGLASADEN